jgi:aspartate/tyrosine/aromatic aminotransferase
MFAQIPLAPADPILGLTEAFRQDPRSEKINLGVGVFQDEAGITPVMAAVKAAEAHLLAQEQSKGYLPIEGQARYGEQVRRLLFGSMAVDAAITVQAPGGTGALRLAGEFLNRMMGARRLWVSNPTWANHQGIFQAAGFTLSEYAYFDAATSQLDFDGLLRDLAQVDAADVVLLHGCCHNPSGVDPTPEQWHQIADVLAQRGAMVLVDLAYQGLGLGLEEDVQSLKILLGKIPNLLIASSFSKNFGLYSERVGALTVVTSEPSQAAAVLSQLKVLVRGLYSNPPSHGAAVVTTILEDAQLRRQWEQELAGMRQRIQQLRKEFVSGLTAAGVERDFSFITRQLGMFSFSGLTPAQVARLQQEYGIYMVSSGRMNVAGMRQQNIPQLCQAIAAVL